MDKGKIGMWVGVGVVAAAVVIYLGVTGVFTGGTQQGTTGPTGTTGPAGAAPTVTAPISAVPQQSEPLKAGQAVPSKAFKLTVSATGFSPNTFSVNSGDKVTIALISGDQFAHTLQFDDPSLSNFAIGISPGETRTIEFTAPKAGSYKFSCGIPGHAGRGETGTMTVR